MENLVTPSQGQVGAAVSTLVPQATVAETLGIFAGVFLPTIAKGVIIRRPFVMAIADRLDFDRRAVRRMQRLRNKYGAGPLLVRIPGRTLALVFDPGHVHRILGETPLPFATETPEKRAALAHFEPKNVLISHGPERAVRRRFHEQALEPDNPVHRLAGTFVEVIASEAAELRRAPGRNELTWSDFAKTWSRVVRRIVFGDAAREDDELSAIMSKLRSRGNWAFLWPQNSELRDRLFARIHYYLDRADPNSLAGVVARIRTTDETAPEHQIPQWLFAFDPAGMATFRALALLASHPQQAVHAREEITSRAQDLPFLRATLLESLRLWPTSPLILRETTTDTVWETGVVPAHTGLVIFTPFFHRDSESLTYADRFHPDLWLDEQYSHRWPLIPFSEGPAICPGRQLVLLLGSTMLASLLENGRYRLRPYGKLSADRPLPGTLNHFALRFDMLVR